MGWQNCKFHARQPYQFEPSRVEQTVLRKIDSQRERTRDYIYAGCLATIGLHVPHIYYTRIYTYTRMCSRVHT